MIDLIELRKAIQNMTRQQGIYKVLCSELTKLGYWHKLPRGNPSAGYKKGWGKHRAKNF